MSTPLEKLNEVYQYALRSEHSDFYRGKYGDTVLETLSQLPDWESLPTLTRDEITKVPYFERLFIPKADVDVIRTSSGTSGRKLMIIPRNYAVPFERVYKKEDFTATSMLSFTANPHNQLHTLREAFPSILYTIGDLGDLSATMQAFRQAKVDCIVGPTFALTALEKEFTPADYEQVRHVYVFGELMTEAQYEQMQRRFPHADIGAFYSASELQGSASFSKIADIGLNRYQPSPDFYFEVISEDGDVITKPGVSGELVVSTLHRPNLAFPVLRYRTGDMAALAIHPKNGSMCYEIKGRIHTDVIKIPGGQLIAALCDQCMRAIDPRLIDNYQIEVVSTSTGEQTKTGIIVHILDTALSAIGTPNDVLGQRIATTLQVSPTATYQDGIDKELFALVVITPEPNSFFHGRKVTRLTKKPS